MYKLNSVGKRGHPCLTPSWTLLHDMCQDLLKILHRLWCTWLLQPVANEVVPPNFLYVFP